MKPVPHIEIREFPDSALPQLWAWCEAFRNQVADDYSPKTIDKFVEYELERTRAKVLKFGVYRDGELGGCIWVEQLSDLIAEAHCVFKRDFFGQATTLPALKLMAEMIFETGIKKIKMRTFRDNSAIKSLLLNAGAHQEGILRQETVRNGKLIDILLFAFFDEDLKRQQEDGSFPWRKSKSKEQSA